MKRGSFFWLCSACAVTTLLPASSKSEVPPPPSPTAAVDTVASFSQRVEQELRGDILPFWIAHTIDREHEGFYGEISNDLVVRKNAPRGALLTSRILWTYSAAYRRYHDKAYLEMARWAYHDLVNHFWDGDYGGLFWSITVEGKPLKVEKQVYGQVFGIYALAEFFRATQEPEALTYATRIYRLLEEHAHDDKFGGYFEVCPRTWQRAVAVPASDNGSADATKGPGKSSPAAVVSAMEAGGSKTQNTHLHVLEAFTNLLRAWPDPGLRKSQSALIDLMLTKILDPKTHHLILYMNDDWSPRSDGISFGHDIEASWLLNEAAEAVGDDALRQRVKTVSLQIAQATLEQGLDADGSLLYEATPHGVTDSRREWWPQAEAAVGFYNAYQLSHDQRFRDASYRVWDYIESHLVDHKNGEWYRSVTKDGVVSGQPKVSLWKCPYHNGRCCLELLERSEAVSRTDK